MTWRCSEAHRDDRTGRLVRCKSTTRPNGSFCAEHQPAAPARGACSAADPIEAGRQLADRLRTGRRDRGLTQSRLARLIDVSEQSVSNWERGATAPDAPMLAPIAHALGVDPNWLLGIEWVTDVR